jgi:hypothetical protein
MKPSNVSLANSGRAPGHGRRSSDFRHRAALGASTVALLWASACASLWGFDDLQDSTHGGGGEAGTTAPASGGGGKIQDASGTALSHGVDATAAGGRGDGDDAAGQRVFENSDASGATTDAASEGMIGVADTSGSAGSSPGLDGAAGSRGSAGGGGIGDGAADADGSDGAPSVRAVDGGDGAPACGPSNCANGCCAGNRCIIAPTTQQCGTGGGACTLCGGCQLCGPTGACTIDPASRWIVRCAAAELTVAPPTGATWDPSGNGADGPEPDPFCQFELPSGVLDANTGAATRTVNDSFAAVWNQTVTAGNSTISAADLMSANADAWRVWVGDTEFNGRATLACEVHPPLAASALIDGQLIIANVQNCVSFTVTLVCQP